MFDCCFGRHGRHAVARGESCNCDGFRQDACGTDGESKVKRCFACGSDVAGLCVGGGSFTRPVSAPFAADVDRAFQLGSAASSPPLSSRSVTIAQRRRPRIREGQLRCESQSWSPFTATLTPRTRLTNYGRELVGDMVANSAPPSSLQSAVEWCAASLRSASCLCRRTPLTPSRAFYL